MAQHSVHKKRSQSCYDTYVKRVTRWYKHLQKERANPTGDNLINPNNKKEPIRRELKALSEYIDKIKKPSKGD